MLRGLIVLVLGILLAGQVRAEDKTPLYGVWTGTIGTFPVNVCLQANDDQTYSFGAYYYLSHLGLINLQHDDKGNWVEGTDTSKPDAVWTLNMGGDDTVSGSWVGHGKTLDVSLHRLAKLSEAEDENGPCGSDAFFQPRMTPIKIKETAAKVDGHGYTQLDVDAGKQFEITYDTFRLDGSTAAIKKLNETFLPDGGKGYVECLQGATAMGYDGTYDVHNTPKVLTEHWLVVESGDGSFCGGAHPINSSTEVVYDLRTGEAVDISKWLTEAAMKDNVLKGKLAQMVNAEYAKGRSGDDEKECRDAVKEAESWGVSLTHKGLNFSPELPYVTNACADSTEISFDKMAPFLTADGKKQLAAYQSELP